LLRLGLISVNAGSERYNLDSYGWLHIDKCLVTTFHNKLKVDRVEPVVEVEVFAVHLFVLLQLQFEFDIFRAWQLVDYSAAAERVRGAHFKPMAFIGRELHVAD